MSFPLDEALDELGRDPGRTVRARLGGRTVEMHRVGPGDHELAEQTMAELLRTGRPIVPAKTVGRSVTASYPRRACALVIDELRRDRDEH